MPLIENTTLWIFRNKQSLIYILQGSTRLHAMLRCSRSVHYHNLSDHSQICLGVPYNYQINIRPGIHTILILTVIKSGVKPAQIRMPYITDKRALVWFLLRHILERFCNIHVTLLYTYDLFVTCTWSLCTTHVISLLLILHL